MNEVPIACRVFGTSDRHERTVRYRSIRRTAESHPHREERFAPQGSQEDLSTPGHRFVKDMLFGSVANEVRHNTRVPVLLVRGAAQDHAADPGGQASARKLNPL